MRSELLQQINLFNLEYSHLDSAEDEKDINTSKCLKNLII